jgi:hypothetical protein
MSATSDSDLKALNHVLEERELYQQQKQQRIQFLQQAPMSHYERLLALTEEYQSYSYDTATIYVEKLLDEALLSKETNKIAQAQIKQAFLYLSSGLFHESSDIFQSIDITPCKQDIQAEYYIHYARLLYDMADYAHGKISYEYINYGNQLSEEALKRILPEDTIRYWSTAALYAMKMGESNLAIQRFNRVLETSQITEHQKAIAYSSLAFIYQNMGDMLLANRNIILAAIADIKSCTKETVAMSIVAQNVFARGQVTEAAKYIQAALDDATFYNARHRQVNISRVMPIIEQQQNRRVTWLNICLYILIVGLLLAFVMLYNRHRALVKAEQNIQSTNLQLTEANHIKEECIATFLYNENSVYSIFEKYQRYVKRKAQDKRWEELFSIPAYADVRVLKNNFYKRFDTMFLHIYPNFVEQFNQLLKPDQRICLKTNELLNAELRIFALIRLGINDNAQIAKLLDYSINTIYTYKTRINNATDLTPEQLIQSVMQIK